MDEAISFNGIIEVGILLMIAGIIIPMIPRKNEKKEKTTEHIEIIIFGALYFIIGYIGKKLSNSCGLDMVIVFAIVNIIWILRTISNRNK
ncbi:MAG: hypothetical protein RSD36_18160 [Terrisporobacter sp.]